WLKGILVDGIMGNLSTLFDQVNTQVSSIASQVGTTPAAWNSGVFNMIRNLSDNVILPIAGVILAIVMTMELLQLVVEKNNMHDFETWIFFKWIFKTFCAVLIVTNTWDIIMCVFDVAQSVVSRAAGIINSDASIEITSIVTNLEARLMEMELGELLGMWFQSLFVGVTMSALTICIFVVIYGRMVEIYLVSSVAPIPMATMTNHEWGQMGQNYLRALFALGFQAFLIIVCVAIYAVLVKSISMEGDLNSTIWTCIGYTVLLCFTLFKSGSVAKSIFNAH
ncbi:MAG: CD0415/CD1112 family protein, partial [Raoultibacter sp.]